MYNLIIVCFLLAISKPVNAQTIPSESEVQNFLSNNKILITYREGEVLYGTYFFIEIHYCPNGYGLYGNTIKKTVLGNEQRSNWQEFGTWKVVTQDELVGIHYTTTNGIENFVPVYIYNDNFFIREGLTVLNQGPATCY